MQLWITVCNFSQTYSAEHDQNRHIVFVNPLQNPRIQSVALIGYSAGDFCLRVTFGLLSSRVFQERMERSNIPVPYPEFLTSERASLSNVYFSPRFSTVETSAWFNGLMAFIIELAPNFASKQVEITQFINSTRVDRTEREDASATQEYIMDFTGHNRGAMLNYLGGAGPEMMRRQREIDLLGARRSRLTGRTTLSMHTSMISTDNAMDTILTAALRASFFGSTQSTTRQMTASALPEQGKNAKALSEIEGFNMDSIPEKFCCPLSGAIMDQPVYDPKHSQYKFERAWIEKHLAQKRKNPFTRTPLTITDLMSDAALQTDINYFMQYARNETFCGMKPGFLIGKSF